MKIRPLQDRVIVKRVEEEEKSKGGIIIPDTAKEILKCSMKTNQNRLQRMGVNILKFRARFLDGRQLRLLF